MKHCYSTLLLSALCLCACTSELVPATPEGDVPQTMEVQSAIPGTAYMLFSESAAARIEEGGYDVANVAMGIRSIERIIPDGGEFDARHREAGLHRWYTVRYDKLIPTTKAAEGLSRMDGVTSVSFPREKRLCSTPYFNDPLLYLQWNLFNDGSLPSSLGKDTYADGCDINVLDVWEKYTTGRKDVIVAVLDGAPNPENKDFKNTMIAPGPAGSQCFVEGYEGTTLYPYDHGCNVAAIIGAASNNDYGIAGIAGGNDGNGGVSLLSCEISMANPEAPESEIFASDEAIMRAFVYACDAGAVICNNSWGYVFDSERDAKEYSEAFNVAESPVRTGIDYFVKYAGKDKDGNQTGLMDGGLVVFSSGNTGIKYGCPASYDKVLAVASHGSGYDFAAYSCYGDWVDLVAPGGVDDRRETKDPYSMILGPGAGKGFYYMAGTSQAAPHVSGVAALLVSYFGGPGFTEAILRDYLTGGARKDVLNGKMSGPMLDAYGSFKYALGVHDEITITTSYTGDYSFKSHESASVDFVISGNGSARHPVMLETKCPAISYTATVGSLKMIVDALKAAPGTYPVEICVGKGTPDAVSKKVDVTILPNHPPVVSAQLPDIVVNAAPRQDGAYTYESHSVNLAGYFNDEDGESLDFEVTVEDKNVVEMNAVGYVLSYTPMGYGTSRITVTASDARGESVSQSFVCVGRDTSRKFDVYPNPVHDFLYVRAASPGMTEVEIINTNGATVLSGSDVTSPFNPLKFDVNALAPGSYYVRITLDGEPAETVSVVKY